MCIRKRTLGVTVFPVVVTDVEVSTRQKVRQMPAMTRTPSH